MKNNSETMAWCVNNDGDDGGGMMMWAMM